MSRAKSLCSPWRGWALVVALCAGACGGPPEALDAPPPLPEAPSEGGFVSAQGYERQGMRLKGLLHETYEQHGKKAGTFGVPAIKGFSLSSVAVPGGIHDRVALSQGTLQVWRSAYTGSTPSLFFCFMGTSGETRGCGWSSAGVGMCTPGHLITVSTGACNVQGAEDTVLRVCSGSTPCEYNSTGMLASNDDACGSLSARATFTCPGSGSFNVMVAPYRSSTPLTAKPVAVGADVYPHYNQVLTGAELNGRQVKALTTDGGVIPMRITAVYNELPEPYIKPGRYGVGTTHRYQVEEQQANGQWVPLCGRDVDGGLNVAIPVAGWWDAKGQHHQDDPDLFTFSCGTGVITKCYRWGYRPWDARSAHGSGRTAAELHQACTRMARADYCGSGDSWTLPETDINLWDVAHIQEPATALAGHSFEAGWSTGGAVCLAKARWSHAPEDVFYKDCSNLFTFFDDPEDGTVQRTPRYCSSQEEAQAFSSSAVIFNESAPNLFPGPSVPATY